VRGPRERSLVLGAFCTCRSGRGFRGEIIQLTSRPAYRRAGTGRRSRLRIAGVRRCVANRRANLIRFDEIQPL
jgi:hypothetical protein